MGRKHMAIGALFALGTTLVACGGGGSSLSEDDFLDELNDICDDVTGDLDDLELGDPEDFGDLEDFANEAVDILKPAIESLDKISPPDKLKRDYADFIAAAEDQLTAAEDLADAAADEDEDAVSEAFDDLGAASEDLNDAAAELDAKHCVDEEEPSSTDPATTDESVPDTTDVSIPDSTDDTTPPVTEPVVTMPPNTEPPMTAPPVTAPVGSVTELDVLVEFAPPVGYTFQPVDGDISGLINDIATDPALGPVTSQLGAADVYDSAGNYVARMWILYTSPDFDLGSSDAGLAWWEWVGEGEVSFSEYTTAGGINGYLSDFGDGTSAFGAVIGSFGLGVFGDQGFDVDGLIDGLIAANGG